MANSRQQATPGLRVRARELKQAQRRLALAERAFERPPFGGPEFSAFGLALEVRIAKKAIKQAERALERQRAVVRKRAKAKQKPRHV